MNTEPRALDTARGPDPLPAPPDFKVLVVDDNKDAATSTAQLLKVCGARTQACYRGTAALEVLAWFGPDACVLDLSMPGMDGFELARKVRAKDPGPLLVALTALNDAATLARAEAAGFDVHVTKPVDPARLLGSRARHVARRRAEKDKLAGPA